MDYSQLSDFEINKRVAIATGENIKFIFLDDDDNEIGVLVGRKGCREKKDFDPCNNPADAWPIIHDNLISINFDNDGYDTPESSWCRATAMNGDEYYGDEKRPLRAAMIVFLMMQDAKHA